MGGGKDLWLSIDSSMKPQKVGSDSEPLRGRLQPSRRAERDFLRKGGAAA